MWPSEGSVSPEAAELLHAPPACAGSRPTRNGAVAFARRGSPGASGSTSRMDVRDAEGRPRSFFFRDHELSDRIGFVYSTWAAGRGPGFRHRLPDPTLHAGQACPLRPVERRSTARTAGNATPDGQHAFPLRALRALEGAPDIRTCTPSEVLDGESAWRRCPRCTRLVDRRRLHIWAGHPEKNGRGICSRARATPRGERRDLRELHRAPGIRCRRPRGRTGSVVRRGTTTRRTRRSSTASSARIFRECMSPAGLPVPGWLSLP